MKSSTYETGQRYVYYAHLETLSFLLNVYFIYLLHYFP